MTNILLIVIIFFEIIRLWVYLVDSRRVNKMNSQHQIWQDKALDFSKQQSEDWKLLRKAEIDELRQLAKESDTMKQIYDEWIAATAKNEIDKV